MTGFEEIHELHAQLMAQEREAARLLRELETSLTIAKLWPGIWQQAKGHCVRSNWARTGVNMTFYVTIYESADNLERIEQRSFARPDVPEILDSEKATSEAREWFKRYARGRLQAFNNREI